MKTKQKRINSATRAVLILLTALLLLCTFVSCGGLPASQSPDEKTDNKTVYVAPSETETDKPATTTVRYAASSESNKYHRLSCRYVDNILPENLVYYTSEEAAQRAGKSPCSVCKP